MSKPNGRPRMYDSPEAFDAMVDAYVADCQEKKEPLTFTGLAIFLGFSSRHSIDDYKSYDGFSRSVARAKLFVENQYELQLYTPNTSGARFALSNYGWQNNSSVSVSNPDGSLAPNITTVDPIEAAKQYQEIMNGNG